MTDQEAAKAMQEAIERKLLAEQLFPRKRWRHWIKLQWRALKAWFVSVFCPPKPFTHISLPGIRGGYAKLDRRTLVSVMTVRMPAELEFVPIEFTIGEPKPAARPFPDDEDWEGICR